MTRFVRAGLEKTVALRPELTHNTANEHSGITKAPSKRVGKKLFLEIRRNYLTSDEVFFYMKVLTMKEDA